MAADPATIRQAIEAYVWLIESPDLSAEKRLEALPSTLDGLASSVHETNFTFDEADYPDAPILDYDSIRALVQRHFPELGLLQPCRPDDAAHW